MPLIAPEGIQAGSLPFAFTAKRMKKMIGETTTGYIQLLSEALGEARNKRGMFYHVRTLRLIDRSP